MSRQPTSSLDGPELATQCLGRHPHHAKETAEQKIKDYERTLHVVSQLRPPGMDDESKPSVALRALADHMALQGLGDYVPDLYGASQILIDLAMKYEREGR